MAIFPTVSGIIREVFPNLPSHRIERIARVIVSSCDDYWEATDIAYKIPAMPWGTFRFDAKSKQWVILYNSFGDMVDH
jgi:hypothetical protein